MGTYQKKGPKMKLLSLLLVLPALLFGGTPRDHQIAAVDALNKRDIKAYVDGYYSTPAEKGKSINYPVDLWKKHPLMRTQFLDCNVIMVSPTEAQVLGAIFTSRGSRPTNIWVYEESLILVNGKWLATNVSAVAFLDMNKVTWTEAVERCRDKYGLDIGN